MFILNPDIYLTPSYRISPFTTSDINYNSQILPGNFKLGIKYLNDRFGENNWIITRNGRQAINLALKMFQLSQGDNVTILTTSQNKYISSCVTNEIEKICLWDRNISKKTSVCLVNHEFGYLHSGIKELKMMNIPLIEDCCTTFFSQDKNIRIGKYGEFSAYSFPKFFPIQIGGLLVGNSISLNTKLLNELDLDQKVINYILKVIGYYVSRQNLLLQKRKDIFNYATNCFENLGFSLRFQHQDGEVPSVLLLKNNGLINNLQAHKDFLTKHGIQNSVFYGEDSFFIPSHQNLNKKDIDYFIFVTKKFMYRQ